MTSGITTGSGVQRLLSTVGRNLVATFAVIALLVGLVFAMLFNTVGTLSNNGDQVEHTYQVLMVIASVRSSLTSAETGQRGFLITGQDDYLAPYTQAQSDLESQQEELRELTSDNARQQKRLDTLAPLITAKLSEMQNTIDLRREQSFRAARDVVLTNQGKTVMATSPP
ncbi:CHASE3 domain-containing protein [Kineosporia sp. J2-2]|uniref:CHASE3 domain-containing protein n=1 Tax=Kineosporia corallincola TaxID=2835133 RepID=A0ABS5TFN9_9ACTN|nr:CHASE3 domain-containing protein [Kineosporia corallincola]MBT0769906.1 CHASE3 domain-containing protein [Kineosporia corallincola]